MTRSSQQIIVGLIGIAGLVIFLLGLFTDVLTFMVGLVIAIGFWSIGGLLSRTWDVPTFTDKSGTAR